MLFLDRYSPQYRLKSIMTELKQPLIVRKPPSLRKKLKNSKGANLVKISTVSETTILHKILDPKCTKSKN